MYGLDPRELVGGTYGGTWYLPGNNYGAVAKFLPVYIQQYADDATAGQPYYTASPIAGGTTVKQRFVMTDAQQITAIGAFLTASDRFAVSVFVNGTLKDSVTLAGNTDQFVSAPLHSVLSVSPGSNLDVVATPGAYGSLRSLYADDVFSRLLNLGANYAWSFNAQPNRTVPLYPIVTSAESRVICTWSRVRWTSGCDLGTVKTSALRRTGGGGTQSWYVARHGARGAKRDHVVGLRSRPSRKATARRPAGAGDRVDKQRLRRAATSRRPETGR